MPFGFSGLSGIASMLPNMYGGQQGGFNIRATEVAGTPRQAIGQYQTPQTPPPMNNIMPSDVITDADYQYFTPEQQMQYLYNSGRGYAVQQQPMENPMQPQQDVGMMNNQFMGNQFMDSMYRSGPVRMPSVPNIMGARYMWW